MSFSKGTCFTLLQTALLATSVPVSTAEAQDSGRVGAVNLEATGTPPGAGSRMLSIGTNVIYKERIQTSASGSTQIMLPDTATLNVGRNSSIAIDEYVYDPKARTGTMVASVSKGLMRFVGGQISHTVGVTVNTPVATLGIRGGVATIVYPVPPGFGGSDPKLAQARGEIVIGHVGSIVLKNKAGSVIVRPGYMTWVTGPNDPIPEPFPVPEFLLQKIMTALTSGAGQTGGVSDLPTDQMAARLGFGKTIVTDPARPPGTDPLGYVSIFDGGNAAAKSKSQSNQTRQVQAPSGPTAAATGPASALPPTTDPDPTAPPTTGPGTTLPPTTGPGTTLPPTTGPVTTLPPTTGPVTTLPPTI